MSLSYVTTANGYQYVVLDTCPFCEYEFSKNEKRNLHFADNHGPEVIPSRADPSRKPATMRGRGGAD